MKTNPSQRSYESIEKLKNLTENIPFFKQLITNFEEKAHKDCCTALKHLFIEKDQYVCRIGEVGDLFYIILHGSVRILSSNSTNTKSSETLVLTPGCAFGEFALIKNKPRLATVICTENTHFAVLSKKDFVKILGTFTNKKFDEIAKFLKSLPIFSKWSLNSLMKLSYYFRSVKSKRNKVLFKEGEVSEYVYIVRKGELEISKGIMMTPPSKVVIGNYGRPLKSIKKKIVFHEGRICIVGPGEVIGDEDVYNTGYYINTCKCYSSTAELLQITSSEFKKRIRDEDSLSALAEKNTFRDLHSRATMKTIKEIKTSIPAPSRSRSIEEIKIITDIKALNPWNSKEFFPIRPSHTSSWSIHSPKYTYTSTPVYNSTHNYLFSPGQTPVLKDKFF